MNKLSKYTLFVLDFMKKIPDKRTGKNTMYTIPQLGMTALAAFFSRSASLRKFLLTLPGFKDDDMNTFFVSLTYGDRPDGLPRKIPTDNHIRSQLDGVDPIIFFNAMWQMASDLVSAEGGSKYRLFGRTVVVPYVARHYSSESISCPFCMSKSYETIRRKVFKVEHFHSLAGFSLFAEPKAIPQLPPEFLKAEDFHGAVTDGSFRGTPGDDSPEPKLTEVLKKWSLRNRHLLDRLRPVFVLRQGLGSFQAQAALQEGHDFILILNGETKEQIKRHAPEIISMAAMPAEDEEDDTKYQDIGPILHERGLVGRGVHAWVLPNGRLERTLPSLTKQDRFNRLVLTSIPPDEWELDKIARTVNQLTEFNFQNEFRNQGFGLTRNFGHGRKTLSEVMAVLNFLALDMYYLSKF
ncbi:MAG: hypothetical protein LBF40_03615 [Deltaproteobacteria bacterium]|jgi:hypothetical protein|nr:hypothetical protein [Deltaproteobacteria bacterium]